LADISNNQIKELAVRGSPDSSTLGEIYKEGSLYKIFNGREHFHIGELQVFDMYDDVGSFPATGTTGALYYTRITGEVYIWDKTQYNNISGKTIYEYDTDLLGHIGTTPSGTENGPEYFSVPTSVSGRVAEVFIDGIKQRDTTYDTATYPGYVHFPVAIPDASWLQIEI